MRRSTTTLGLVVVCVGCSSSGESPQDTAGDGTGGIMVGDSSESSAGADESGFDPPPIGDLGGADDGGPTACADELPPPLQVVIDPGCAADPVIGSFEPVVKWSVSSWSVGAASRESAMTPLVLQLTDDDGDGLIDHHDTPDVLALTYGSGYLRGLSGTDGAEVLNAAAPGFGRADGLAAADIDNDGIVEIVGISGGTSHGTPTAFEHDGTVKWTGPSLAGHVSTNDSTPAFGDMDGDGTTEIVIGRAILDANGNLLATGQYGWGSPGTDASLSFPADVDGDGFQEVVVGNALYRMDGSAIWHHGEGDGYPGIADFDLDGTPEIVVVRTGHVALHESTDGATRWNVALPTGAGGPPTVADFDGDGLPEIGVASSSAYSVFDGDGSLLWTRTTQDLSSGVTGSSVFDFEGDGISEVVYADETRLWVFSGTDGAVKLEYDGHSSGTRLEYPVVADIDNDGHAEIVVVHESYQTNHFGVTVVTDANNSWRPARGLWNQHAYHISNIDDDGGVPVAPVSSWLDHNTFRAGDLLPNDGLVQPDVVLDAATCARCDGDMRTLWIQLANAGAGALQQGADIEIRGRNAAGAVLLDTIVFGELLAAGGTADTIEVQVDSMEYDSLEISVVVHEDECKPTAPVVLELEPCEQPAG
jgi:hypothetical protein